MYVTGPVCMDVWVGGWMICIRHPNKIKPGGKTSPCFPAFPITFSLLRVFPLQITLESSGKRPVIGSAHVAARGRAGVRVSYVCARVCVCGGGGGALKMEGNLH